MTAGPDALEDSDRKMVRAVAGAGFGNISLMLKRRAPGTAQKLDSFQLTEEQRDAVLRVVHHMGDPRVQSVGAELGAALHSFFQSPSADREGMELHIQRALQPRLGDLRRLRDEVIAAPLRGPGGGAASDRGSVTLDTKRMKIVRTYDDSWKLEFDTSRPRPQRSQDGSLYKKRRRLVVAGASDDAPKPFGVAGGVVEQASVILDQLKAVLGTFDIDIKVPHWLISLDGRSESFLTELLSCVVDGTGSTAQRIMCPMKFASAGLDVLSGIIVNSGNEAEAAAPGSIWKLR